jgi:hypothetical protein
VAERGRALYIKGQYNLETKDGKEGYSNAKFYAEEGQWSIGWKPAPGTAYRRKSDGARVLPKVDFYERSDVMHGAAPQTSTLGVKAVDAGGFGEGLEEKFDPAQPRASDGTWTATGGSGGPAPAGPGEGDARLGPDWLKRVLAGDSSVVQRAGGGSGGGGGAGSGDAKQECNAEQDRRDKVEAAFDKERAAERTRRNEAAQAIGAATGADKKTLQTAEKERRRAWQSRVRHRPRRRTGPAPQVGRRPAQRRREDGGVPGPRRGTGPGHRR